MYIYLMNEMGRYKETEQEARERIARINEAGIPAFYIYPHEEIPFPSQMEIRGYGKSQRVRHFIQQGK